MEDVSNPSQLVTQAERTEAAVDEVFVFPASFAQQRLWFLDRLQPGQSVYNVPFAMRLTGSLRVDVLQRSLDTLLKRHEVLRTVFSEDETGNPIQVVNGWQQVELPITDLRNASLERREEEARSLLLELSRLPFDLQKGPLFRANLIRVADEEHIFSLVFHHIIVDGWSWSVVLKEIASLYKAFLQDLPSPLPDLPIQYGDYASWQRDQIQGEQLTKLLNYWRRQLDGAPPILELPTDFQRPAVQSYRGEVLPAIVPKRLLDSLQELAAGEGCTLFMVLLAAFNLLLARYSRQDDIVVGTPIAGRLRSELEQLVGFFVNTLAFRTDLSGNPSFQELLRRVREVTLAGFAHQELPFEKMVEELRPDRRLSHTPVFQAMLFLHNVPRTSIELPGLTLESMEVTSGTAKFDVMMSAAVKPDGLRLGLTYNVDLFRASTMQAMLSHFQYLLESIVANPRQPISSLPLVGPEELRQMVAGWNQTKRSYPQKCVHELFEAQAEKTPNSIAVRLGEATQPPVEISDNGQLTYAELNQNANQLAHYLIEQGVKPGSRVGICMERSLEMVISVLATLKAGAAYVPLDPEYPRDRLGFMVQDGDLAVLLTQQRIAPALAVTNVAKILSVDSDWKQISKQSIQNPVGLAAPENLVYVIYTSGSTGRPKGVCLPHQSLSNLLFWQLENSCAGVGTRTLQFTSLSFDVSFQEIFSTWCSGGTLVLISESIRRDASALLNFLRDHEIGRLFLPFVALQQLAEVADETQNLPLSLVEVITAGEQLHITRQLANFFSRMRGCALFNHYGPSESHVVTSFQLTGEPDSWDALPPIGKPIANTEIYILDPFLNPVPLGVSGELYIGGFPLADGYLNRPELTAERFIANPFVNDPGKRLYRTGDLCRYLPDGNIQYLGRIDNQVKLRGYRIELGEVESVLAKHPAVQHAVAMVREDVPGDKRLVAYVVLGQDISFTELRAHLKQTLPDYMVPSAFVKMEALPLTPSGKVSRRALPPPNPDEAESVSDSFALRSPLEELLSAVWSEVLQRGKVGVHDNFFDLGGHSLLATRLVSRIRRDLQVDLALRTIFEHPTIAELARCIETMRKGPDTLEVPALVPQPHRVEKNALGQDVAVFPLSFAEQRLWVLDRLEPNSSVYNLSISLRLKGRLAVRAMELSLEEIQQRHEILRARFRLTEQGPEQCILPVQPVSLPVRDISAEQDAEAKALEIVRHDSRRPFNLEQDPMLRATLLKLGNDDHVLLLTVHHIVFDGWSRSVLIRELSTLYKAYSEGKSSPLPDLPLQYTDFAAWQRKYLSGEVLDRQLSYWKQQLAGAPSHLDLPTDRPRPAEQTFHGSHVSMAVSKTLADQLNELSRKSGVTLFMTLLGAFNILLSRYSGQDQIVVGSPIAGRNQSELEKLIGFFVNALPLRTNLAGDISFRELLGSIREATLEAYAHQDLPFEKLVEEIKPERDPSRNPIFQFMFAWQNLPNEAIELPGLRIDSFRSGQAVNAKFDICLYAVENPDKLTFLFEYNTDLFDKATIERMAGHLENLLQAIVESPNQNIASLPMLSQAEQTELLHKWNETQEYPVEFCVHQLFEQQARRVPNNVALVCEGQTLSYAELNARSNQLARYLTRMGVGPDVLVGLCMERSLDMVIGILGVVKAGGAYLPLDPRYPKDRLTFMLEDAKPAVVLTQYELKELLPHVTERLVAIDADWAEIQWEDATDVLCPVRPENLAYVIYTSGSTGRPKGCQITHANVVRLFQATQHWYGFNDSDVWTMFHSYAFDFSVWELWGALIYGGRLVVVPYVLSRSPEEFYRLLEEEKVTVLNQTPSSFRQLMHAEERLGTSSALALRYVIFGGEALEMQSLRPWFERHGDRKPQLVNMYGITETTVHVTYRPLSMSDTAAGSVIGRPIPDLQVYLLDRHLQPAPIGVPGEMYVGGAGVARGYLNRPELNRERFTPDMFRPVGASNRLYKSGDLARRLANGDIEYLGRIDQQVKIRGFRIELGEIETALAQHPAVKHAVVVVREDTPGDKRLVAYLVADGEAPTSDDLRTQLKRSLPEYMIPSAFVALTSFPLTANGKVDRPALPAPDGQMLGSSEEFVAPRTPTEQMIASIWSEVLRITTVGVHQDFFVLGGHSLLATQVISRIQKQFERDVPLRMLFEHSTVAELARALDEYETTSSRTETEIAPISMDAFRVKRSQL